MNLDDPGQAKQVARRIQADIAAYCQKAYDGGHRRHLGASLIGHTCNRYLWYTFRWCKHVKHDGRMLRLFNRGHREEARFIEWLRGIGATVWEYGKDGKQFTVSGGYGHFGGSLDGVCKLPAPYGIESPLLTEYKTSGTGSKFKDVIGKGVVIAKPQHYAQMCVYGQYHKLSHALYMIIDKNTDNMHVELIKLDWAYGRQLEEKACRIIGSQEPFEKIAVNSAFFTCAYCDYKGICHEGEPIEQNCRSCRNAVPYEQGVWACTKPEGVDVLSHMTACLRYEAIA